jgi:hypothetical protein
MTVSETFRASRADEADEYLTRAAEYASNGDQLRQVTAMVGIGQAVLALGETLDGRLADVADAVTDVRTQVAELADAVQAPRRGWWRRGAARPALTAADMTMIRRALADAAAWCRIDECSAGADNERLAFSYLALRERLEGGQS